MWVVSQRNRFGIGEGRGLEFKITICREQIPQETVFMRWELVAWRKRDLVVVAIVQLHRSAVSIAERIQMLCRAYVERSRRYRGRGEDFLL